MNEICTPSPKEVSLKDGMVHFILSHSYVVFMVAVVCGVFLDSAFVFNIFKYSAYAYGGFSMIIGGSILIYWAQSSSSRIKKVKGIPVSEKDFERGPYKYSRNPTHIGMTIMTLGLALVLNSFFMLICVLLASLITKFIFLKKEEQLLEEKYGEQYLLYKKKVSTWV